MELAKSNLDYMSLNNMILYIVQSVMVGEKLDEKTQRRIALNIDNRFPPLREKLDFLVGQMEDNMRRAPPFKEHSDITTQMQLAHVALDGGHLHDELLDSVKRAENGPELVQRVQEFRTLRSGRRKFDCPGLLGYMEEYDVDVTLYTRTKSTGGLIMYGTKNTKSMSRLAEKPATRIVGAKVKRIVGSQNPEYTGDRLQGNRLLDGRIHDAVGLEAVFEMGPRGGKQMSKFLTFFRDSPYTIVEDIESKSGLYEAEHLDLVVKTDPTEKEDSGNEDCVEVHLMRLQPYLEKLIGKERNQSRWASMGSIGRGLDLAEHLDVITPEDRRFMADSKQAILQVLQHCEVYKKED